MKKRSHQENFQQPKHDTEETYGRSETYESQSTELVPDAKTPDNAEHKDKKKKKLTRKERKALAKEQAEYEKELVKEGKIAPRYRYAPRNGFARIVSVCVAFFIGFFAAFGVLVGGLAIFGDKKKIKEVADVAGFDYSSVFTDYSAELSTLDFIVEIVQNIKDGEFKSLGDVSKYISFADRLADSVITQLNDAGVTAEKDELLAVPFSEIGSWLQEKLAGISADDYINTHTLGQVLTIDENSATILQSLKDTLLCDLSDAAKTLRLCDMISAEDLESNKILKNLKDSTLDSLPSDVENLTVEQVFGDEMYSYLSIQECGGTYDELVAAYETNRTTEDGSELVPRPVKLEEGDEVKAEEEDGTVRYYLYRNGEKSDELDRYLDGTWYLLFGDGNDKNTSILAMSANVAAVITKVNEMPLWELWLRGIIKTNPFSEILYGEKQNLNELTITELIQYVQFLTQNT